MAIDSVIVGGTSGLKAEVNSLNHIKVVPETDVGTNPGNVGGVKVYGSNDDGQITGEVKLASPEVDIDYRMRVSQDTIHDEEIFNYLNQNTGKHTFASTTMAATWTAGQFTTNSGAGITTTTTGVQLATYAAFPAIGTTTLSADVETAFNNQPVTNSFIEFGLGIPGSQTAAPTDGVFLRLNASGLQGIVSFNGSETSSGIFPLADGAGVWTYVDNKRYQFIIYVGAVVAEFWVNDGTGAVLLGTIPLPSGQGRVGMAGGLQFFYKHRITGGAAGGILQSFLGAYSIRSGGTNNTTSPTEAGSRMFGSYQGLSGGTMGSLATYPNSTNPTAAAPGNTSLTANLPGGLGGQGVVTAAVAAATDGIWGSYQVPAGSVNFSGRRLVLRGVFVDAVNTGAAVATTATTIQFSLAFGHTAVSLATAEAATTKASRRIPLGFMTWAVGAAIGQGPQGGKLSLDFGDAPVYINPGEFIQLVGKFIVGTATASQTITFTWTPIYGWE